MTDTTKAEDDERPLPANWILQHPKYQEMMNLEIGDESQIYAAFLVYLDLLEVRQWQDVCSRGSPELQLVLLEGREKEGDPLQVILPLPGNRTLSHRWVRSVLNGGDSMLLCAVASDSSLVYQRLCEGLLTPDPPIDIQDKGRSQHRKRRLR
ncbi:tRNA-splicing endonuclease subunit Sen15 [Paramormyrops kingsleyae]|uniref:TSEN15 tRNA splicing endonuclease subunit n=1 Tax=Paramormyrops kingsleyae TaxID=1676925 RepID=A0A3B3RZE6_9TELE|nr:tRNA-splicing endonuclease subunit Sen15 [Paramormyrops kingsleyae]